MPHKALILSLFLLAAALQASAEPTPPGEMPVFDQVAGEIREVTIKPGDTLIALSAEHGVRVSNIMAANDIRDAAKIYPGQKLTIDTLRIVPSLIEQGLVADIAAAMLFNFRDGALASRHPAGYGTPQRQTPTGSFFVLFAEDKPEHPYPVSVKREFDNEAHVSKKRSLPAPPHALGPGWIQLSTWGLGIHATRYPSTVGRFMSHSQVRLSPEDLSVIAKSVRQGTKIEIAYLPVRAAVLPSGEVWLEAHPDVYDLGTPDTEEVTAALSKRAGSLDSDKIDKVLRAKTGTATLVGFVEAEVANGNGEAGAAKASAKWICLDCPPGANRRVTFQLEALEALELPNSFPVLIKNDSGLVVYKSKTESVTPIFMSKGEVRNFVWEILDSEGQPLQPGSYMAEIEIYPTMDSVERLKLPLWVGR